MKIYFLRHANAGEPKLNPVNDEKRPLDELGIEQSHDVGRALAAMNVAVAAIISSPLPRAAQTAAVVAKEIAYEGEVLIDSTLLPDASYEQFQDLLARHRGKDAIMLVGHNPTMTEFLNKLVNGGGQGIEFKKCAVARVDKDGRKSAVLKWCFPPKVARSIQQASASNSRPKTVSK